MASEIKIIALGLDGTLLDSAKRLSEGNRAALEAAAAKGIHVVPTTGRFFGMMPECIRELPFVRYAITVNGAQVYDSATDTALVREEISLDTALGIMRLLDGYDVIYDCYRNNWGWMSESFKTKAASYATDVHYLKMIEDFRHGVPELKAHLEATATEGDVQKIMLFTPLNDNGNLVKVIADDVAAAFPDIKVTGSTWNNLEFNARTAHKGMALKRFAESLGLTLANCMSFGDGLNDLTMIEAAGIGVAMSNACPEVRTAAKYITLSNDEDGVAAAMRHFGLT